ncbi:MAG: hypothetical protein ACI4WG_06655 [Erysipelotrichaceae bacterium]
MKKIIPALIFTAAAAGATAMYIKKKLFDTNKVNLIELDFQQDEPDSQETVLSEPEVQPQQTVQEAIEQPEIIVEESSTQPEESNQTDQNQLQETFEETVEQSQMIIEETVEPSQQISEEMEQPAQTDDSFIEQQMAQIEQIVEQYVNPSLEENQMLDESQQFEDEVQVVIENETVEPLEEITDEIDQIIGEIINQKQQPFETDAENETVETTVDENTIEDLISSFEEQKNNQQAMDDIEELIEDEIVEIDENEMSDEELVEKFSKQYPSITSKRISLILATIDRMIDAVGDCDYITIQHFIEFDDNKHKDRFAEIAPTVGYELEQSRKNKELSLSATVINNRLTIAHTILSLADSANEYYGSYNGWAVKSTE